MQLIQRGIIPVRVQRLRNRGQNASRKMLKRTQLLYACVFCLLCKYFLQGRQVVLKWPGFFSRKKLHLWYSPVFAVMYKKFQFFKGSTSKLNRICIIAQNPAEIFDMPQSSKKFCCQFFHLKKKHTLEKAAAQNIQLYLSLTFSERKKTEYQEISL